MSWLNRFTVFRVMIFLVIALLLFSGVSLVFRIGQFYERLDACSGAAARGDQLALREELLRLKSFDDKFIKYLKPLGLVGLASRKLFYQADYFEWEYDYLTGNYDKLLEKLKENDNIWACYVRGNSKWRLAQGIFEQSLKMDEKTKIEMQKKAVEIASSDKDDYEQVIRKDPNSTFPPKWNYDLVTNPEAMAKALAPKPGKLKVMLGQGGKKNKGSGQDKGLGPKGGGDEELNVVGPEKEGKPKQHNSRPG